MCHVFYWLLQLRSLGELCGLLPGASPNSEQLHIVVSLSAGMGDNPGTHNSPSPTDKLKEALCSQEAFNKAYLVSVGFLKLSYLFDVSCTLLLPVIFFFYEGKVIRFR